MKALALLIGLLVLSGCTAAGIPITTESLDAAGNVVSKTTTTVAKSSTAKTLGLYAAHVEVEKQNTAQNVNAGFTVDIYGLGVTQYNGQTVLFAQTKISNRPVIHKTSNLPDRIPDHWAKEVALGFAKYGFYAFGVDKLSGVFSEALAGAARGLTVNGDGNVLQGNQNVSRGNQSIRADYVTALDEVTEYTDDEGNCKVSPTCSCDSYAAGLCTP